MVEILAMTRKTTHQPNTPIRSAYAADALTRLDALTMNLRNEE